MLGLHSGSSLCVRSCQRKNGIAGAEDGAVAGYNNGAGTEDGAENGGSDFENYYHLTYSSEHAYFLPQS